MVIQRGRVCVRLSNQEILLTAFVMVTVGCSSRPQQSAEGVSAPSAAEVRAIAKEAYIYGFPLVTNDGKTQFLVANPLKRYLLNSTMLKSFHYGSDGSLTLYVQKDAPGGGKDSNWLPAPDGPFYAILRIYMPAPKVVNGTWKKPQMAPAPSTKI